MFGSGYNIRRGPAAGNRMRIQNTEYRIQEAGAEAEAEREGRKEEVRDRRSEVREEETEYRRQEWEKGEGRVGEVGAKVSRDGLGAYRVK